MRRAHSPAPAHAAAHTQTRTRARKLSPVCMSMWSISVMVWASVAHHAATEKPKQVNYGSGRGASSTEEGRQRDVQAELLPCLASRHRKEAASKPERP
mmetsp:Transcript_10013/g.30645  ORF Transcript_10013/g.30645 Transcript_10013/m.30645 type:complete len:98 (+) Transcript_10013:182-475(+)